MVFVQQCCALIVRFVIRLFYSMILSVVVGYVEHKPLWLSTYRLTSLCTILSCRCWVNWDIIRCSLSASLIVWIAAISSPKCLQFVFKWRKRFVTFLLSKQKMTMQRWIFEALAIEHGFESFLQNIPIAKFVFQHVLYSHQRARTDKKVYLWDSHSVHNNTWVWMFDICLHTVYPLIDAGRHSRRNSNWYTCHLNLIYLSARLGLIRLSTRLHLICRWLLFLVNGRRNVLRCLIQCRAESIHVIFRQCLWKNPRWTTSIIEHQTFW